MKKTLFIAIVTLLVNNIAFSQENKRTVQTGLLRAQGTFSFGKLTEIKQTALYLHGTIEYYLNERVSARGDLFYFLKPNNESLMELNHQMFAGASYHIKTNNNIDPYIGIEPGLAATKYSNDLFIEKPSIAITPLMSGVIGFNYYANNWFHLFVDGRYVYGKHISNLPPSSINEFRISFGLGFNIGT